MNEPTDKDAAAEVEAVNRRLTLEMERLHKHGGPVHPVTYDSGIGTIYHHGMSLRDWFAGQALATNLYMDPKEAADNAYAVADAMLAARGKT